ncbi:MAG: hypothetical protein HN919_07105, partial [Verrucomicrobia bacterium]|nr:hypothetical protein [Verrucomicrobiota bacterium]
MKRIMSGVLLFVLGLGLLAGTTCVATEAVVNGDFSSNAALYTTYPGYNGGPNPAAIDNWSASDVGIGINGSGISTAFGPADKSAATYYAFIQNGGKSLSQDITLSADTAYNVSFLAANRSGESAATGRVVVADASATYYDSGASAWDTTAFQRITDYFITPASIDGTITITLANESGGGGGTVCYSDVAIEPRAPVAATGGNSTYNVGGDRVHEFTSDGTFSVTTGGDIEVLVVAGGGGSGNNGGGGGGAGGVIYDRVFTVVAGSNYTVTVGSGGAGAGSGSVPGSSGTNSIFGPLTSTGGGGGASRDGGGAGVSGGSGGGGGGGGQPQATAGTASPAGQGNKGGGGYNSGGSSAGGGGGGYGSAGTAGASLQGGNGGNGFWSDITGVNTGYAGGGAGSGLASFGGEAGSVEVGAGGGGPENGSRDA